MTTLYSAWVDNSGKGMAVRSDCRGNSLVNAATQPLFLSIDEGGHASRVRVIDPSGKMVEEARQTVEVRPSPAEWDGAGRRCAREVCAVCIGIML